MAVENALQFANRCGLDVKIYKYPKEEGTSAAAVEVPFANECALELNSDITWATGGQSAGKLIGFPNPIEGTFKISTQIVTSKLLALITGGDPSEMAGDVVEFKNDNTADIVYFVIEADTVWKDRTGATKNEQVTIHKALPKRAYNITYNGSGDPISVDVEFELLEGDDGKVVTLDKTSA